MIDVKNVNEVAETSQSIFGPLADMGHEHVLFCSDNDTGLRAIIAVHDSTLGPALGGTRMWTYASDLEALNDVLRLSRGMTFKASISGLNLGGGKAVIMGDSRTLKSEALMRRFGKFVNNLGGKYITAEDVGTSPKDMEYIRMHTKHVTGVSKSMGGSGDPSPVTAYGTYLGIKASMKKLCGNDSLNGKRVIVQGLGNVGYHLVKHLSEENADIFVFDIFEDKIKAVSSEFKVTVISESDVYNMEADVYAPCALGATVNKETISTMNVTIIAGAANNQLEDEIEDANRLMDKGILYAPDFVINAGGLINVYSELEGYNRERAMGRADGIFDTTLSIFEYAAEKNISTSEAAMALAQARIDKVAKLKRYI